MGFLLIIGGIFLFLTGQGFGGLWLAFIGWFLTQAAQQSYQQLLLQQALSGVPVRSVMTEQMDMVPPDLTLDEVVHDYIMGRNHPAFPVQENGQVIGLLCLSDVRAVPRENWNRVTVRQIAPPLSERNTISASADAWEALTRMSAENCGRLVVMDGGAARGIISRTDLMRLIRTRAELGV
jgi:predicted transcriptional regulator